MKTRKKERKKERKNKIHT